MAGTVMHLVIADMLLETLNIKNPSMFYCGNLAPDAIMCRDNYEREMKNHTHFKDGQKPYEFRLRSNQDVYQIRLNNFAQKFLDKASDYYELYLGYIVHILTDELYILRYYEQFILALEQINMSPSDEKFSKSFVNDVDRVDWKLASTYKFKFPMPEILFSLSEYEIPGWITANEIEKSKRFVVDKNFATGHEDEELEVTTMEKNYAIIKICVKEIPMLLKKRFDI